MSAKRVQTNYGALLLTVDPAQSDEESTEAVMNFKPTFESRVSMEEDIWWQINQDFARESEEEFYRPSKKVVARPAGPKVSSVAPVLEDDVWMAINQDFARDESHMDVEVSAPAPKKSVPSLEEPYGDYGVWWE